MGISEWEVFENPRPEVTPIIGDQSRQSDVSLSFGRPNRDVGV